MISVYDDADALVQAAAQNVIASAVDAVERRGRFLIALSGGHSPLPLYRLLSEKPYADQLPWAQTIVLWSDERCVSLDDERSNAGTAMKILLNHVPVPENRVMPMYPRETPPEEAARQYEDSITGLFEKKEPRLDLILLGCGKDGHTASLFPKSSLLQQQGHIRAVTTAPDNLVRLTMMPQLINLSRLVFFIAYGEEKGTAVKNVLEGPHRPDQWPAQSIKPALGEKRWFLDKAAAAALDKIK